MQSKLNLQGDKVAVVKPSGLKVVNGQITLTQAEKDKLKKQRVLNKFKEVCMLEKHQAQVDNLKQ